MSEYKFSCPNCDQHLSGTPAWAGRSLSCPTCKHTFTVPPASGGASAPPLPTAAVARPAVAAARPTAAARPAGPPVVPARAPITPTATPTPAAATPAGARNTLALISMILGIAAMVMGVIGMGLAAVIPILGGLIAMGLFFLGFVASVVGVVLGHKARGQIKRGLATSGAGMALTGIILGYVAIAGAAAMVAIAVVAGFMGYRAARDQMGQPPANVRSVPVMPERAEPARGGQRGDRVTRPGGERGQPAPVRRAPSDPPVTTDPASATIPDARASGTIGREPFRVERAEFNPFLNTLTLQESADRSKRLTIFFFPSEGESALGRVWTMAASAQGNRPHVHYSGGGQGGVEMNNYALRVEFGQPQGGRVTGKIFLELPNSTGVQLAGTFEATVRD